ncbi:snapalysin family zinc-dependent metalloprotease [Actinocatenispora rupis]|uniref:Extracellular small neutral protease n=1 Tax=Actinocatenispora rupis TaxID=519421 RepID=A0A8J3J506_9ACTN|nr:snapalysin family zinc-dependent metalloprotease [Actinocatenispora rupis]GID15896.1 metalloprotease [Actinocatenispora rupis]
MLRRRLARLAVTAVLALAAAPLAAALPAAASAPHLAATTVTYDAGQAPELADHITEAVQIWNDSVSNVRLVPGSPADVTISEGHGGGSYTIPDGLGAGEIYLDLDQAAQYNPTRIAAHEIGHIYGLPDNYDGDCSILMSGHSAGYDCQTTHPSADEAAQVDANFAGGATEVRPAAYAGCFSTGRR